MRGKTVECKIIKWAFIIDILCGYDLQVFYDLSRLVHMLPVAVPEQVFLSSIEWLIYITL